MTGLSRTALDLLPLVGLIFLAGVILFSLVTLGRGVGRRHQEREAAAFRAAMHARDGERRARELTWFDAYRRGTGLPDLAPHEWYATAEEYDWDRARLTVLGFEVLESWRHPQEDGSILYEVLYQGHLDRLQRAAKKLAAI